MSLNPIAATQAVTEAYLSYLSTTFRLQDARLRSQFESLLRRPERLVKGPILEATPPFETVGTLLMLIEEGILSAEFRLLRSEQLPLGRPLYHHQEEAIRKAVAGGRNLVIATGTGSGKTECFLVPILNHLFRQRRRGELTPGVRALLLYPLNALANDQISRLRRLLEHYPHITFGRYTGETIADHREALQQYRKTFQREPLPNELISRDQMRKSPPHILLTNYAMLEYLLLRPHDHVLFDGEQARSWHYLVIDEVHTYSGAKGIEMAMLLRRLKNRVVTGEHGRLQCLATSATIGDVSGFSEVARFAERLFDEPFEWNEEDPARRDVIAGVRKPLEQAGPEWGQPAAGVYQAWREIVNSPLSPEKGFDLLKRSGEAHGIPTEVLAAAAAKAQSDYARFLHATLKGDARLRALQQLLQSGPVYLDAAATELFGADVTGRESLIALVDLAVMAKPAPEDQPLLPARYHLFVRAVEGAYVTFHPEPKIFLERRESYESEDREYPVFEMAVCRQCGSTYLVGETRCGQTYDTFGQPAEGAAEEAGRLEYYLLAGTIEQVPVDEDETIIAGEDTAPHPDDSHLLCTICGGIGRRNRLTPICGCEQPSHVDLLRVRTRDGNVHLCPACGKRSPTSLVWRFLTGQDATASVLATALYQQIPPRCCPVPESQHPPVEDEWSSTAGLAADAAAGGNGNRGTRQLLIFSDSRQDAAFFAPYLERTYNQLVQRRLILLTLEEHRERALENRWRIQDVVRPLWQTAKRQGVMRNLTPQEQETEVWWWVLLELLAIDRRNSLEGLGLLSFHLVRPERWTPPRPLMQPPWSLSAEEVWTLYQILLDSFRTKGAVLFPGAVSPEDEVFYPRNREFYFREGSASKQHGIFSWSSSERRAMNSRLDFLMRLVRHGLRTEISEADCREVLYRIWYSLALDNPQSAWYDCFARKVVPGEGVVYQMKHTAWELQPGTIDTGTTWYQCSKCQNLTPFNLRGICPTYRCDGRLHPCEPDSAFSDNHYRNLYLQILPIPMRAEEHTAQLTGRAAFELQQEFVHGRVNVLSCSTTFELGVDVGELEAIFMRNVPPSASNYVQRAGRAGRRTDSTAFALTYAQRRSHDLTHFQDPKAMVSGRIQPPHLEIRNEKIVRRHVYATALAAFWREYYRCFGQVASFFFDTDGPELFRAFLDRRPQALYTTLRQIVPEELGPALALEDWGWVAGLYDGRDGILMRAADEVRNDVRELEQVWNELIGQHKPSDAILRAINTIKARYIIDFLSSRNVIPKYGFPVDVVELHIQHHGEEAARLELTRDLRIALSEYAPSSQVVAANRLWTARYLRRLPRREWPRYRYAVCEYCQCYQRILEELDGELRECRACGRPLRGKMSSRRFLVPEFGFITERREPGRPGNQRPERTYTTRIYYSGEATQGQGIRLGLRNGVEMLAIPAVDGQLAVINHAGYQYFKICKACGYAVLGGEEPPHPHPKPWGGECPGKLDRYDLGHEFRTDILQLHFQGYRHDDMGFWYSLLYALLEGASAALAIERDDLDGCLYPYAGDPGCPSLILFDDVPGGAGHVRRAAGGPGVLHDILYASLLRLRQCDCGGEEGNASCYGCLRSYRNQFCHDQLNRGVVVRFLEQLL